LLEFAFDLATKLSEQKLPDSEGEMDIMVDMDNNDDLEEDKECGDEEDMNDKECGEEEEGTDPDSQ